MASSLITGIDLYWLPLGAGGHSVRVNGRIFEAVAAWAEKRERCDLYHSALEVNVPEGRFVIEHRSEPATAPSAAWSPAARSEHVRQVGSGCSGTRYDAGGMGSSPMSPRQWRARGA